ncbi:hypothetical protein D9M68_871990 [compost metagenome]
MRDAGGKHARLAGTCTRKNQNRAFGGENGLALFRVQALQIIRFTTLLVACGHGTRCNTSGRWRAVSRCFIAEERHIIREIGHCYRM